MEITALIKRKEDTKTVGNNGFEVRNLVVTTEEQHSQTLEIKFTQNRVNLLDAFEVGQKVKIAINLKGREIIKDDKPVVYNSIEGWKIDKVV